MDRRDLLEVSGGAIAPGAVAAAGEVRSTGQRATRVEVPDFTRERSKTTPPLDFVHI